MSFEAITTISEAEENARRMKAQAALDAKAAEAAAAAEGRETMAAAAAKAAEEIRLSRQSSDAQAMAAAENLAAETENRKAAMLARAGGRLDKAASLIVERIVNG
jgi:vacuolar-type H+-ATPase subunit H